MESKKVGLVTYCAGNLGSALQCFATQKYLSEKGLDCHLFVRQERGLARIRQSLEYRTGAYLKLLKNPKSWAEYKKCRNPVNSNRAMTQKSTDAINCFVGDHIQLEKCTWKQLGKMARSDAYMAFFSGSDQIWSGLWFPTNRIWFLRFCPRSKRVAWAPSFGSDDIAEYNRDIYKRYITEYQFLSVRETSGQKMIYELTGKMAPVLPDPVYLLSAEEWRAIASDVSRPEKYILMFFISEPDKSAMTYAQQLASQKGAEIVWLSYDHCCKGTFVDGGPCEFISYIDNAALVLTDSFHASLFSIILSTPFYVFRRTDVSGDTQVCRIQNLLEKFNIQDRIVEGTRICADTDLDQDAHYEILAAEKGKMDVFLREVMDFYLGGTE